MHVTVTTPNARPRIRRHWYPFEVLPCKTCDDWTASPSIISDPIVPRFFHLYRQTEIFCKLKSNQLESSMESSRTHRVLGTLILLLLANFASAESVRQYSLYLSHDQAQSWSRSDLGLPRESRINAFAASGRTFLAGTDSGIFISTNSAKTWQPATETKSHRVLSLATLDQQTFAGTMNGLLTSTNSGVTWQRNPSFPKQVIIRSLHALDGSIYVGTDAHHVYQSSDRGQSWNHLTAGLPPLSQIFALTSLNGRLFAGLYAKGLYTWDTIQKTWLQLGASAHIAPLALAATDSTLIAGHNPGGIYSSDDLGGTWSSWNFASHSEIPNPSFPIPNSSAASASPIFSFQSSIFNSSPEAPIWEMSANSKIALAGAGDGIFYSTDHARTWTRATTGLPVQSSGIAFLIQENLVLAAIHAKSNCSAPKD